MNDDQLISDLRNIIDAHLEIEEGIPGDPESPTYCYITDEGLKQVLELVQQLKEEA